MGIIQNNFQKKNSTDEPVLQIIDSWAGFFCILQ